MAIKPQALILASASKSRSQMLLNAGVKFSVLAPHVDESTIKSEFSSKTAETIAIKLAASKALKISELHPQAFVIGADQMLDCDGNFFDKPKNCKNAVSHLMAMRGKKHRLTAAVCVVQNGEILWDFTDSVQLTMRNLTDEFIQKYVDDVGADILDTVGAYQLEGLGAQLFTKIEGDYFTVLGLPLLPLLEFLRKKSIIQ